MFYVPTNSVNATTGKMKHDGDEFKSEAMKFCSVHDVPEEYRYPIDIDSLKGLKRRNYGLEKISSLQSEGKRLKCLAFFGHGWWNGCQLGFKVSSLDELVDGLESCATTDIVIWLAACSTAENEEKDSEKENIGPATDGGFADEFRDKLCKKGKINCKVYGHKTAGHTTWNPNAVVFAGNGSETGGTGGEWVISPESNLWNTWMNTLKTTDLRHTYPFKSQKEIEAILSSEKA